LSTTEAFTLRVNNIQD